MVFFTSLLVVIILYYLQAEGLIFVTIIAVGGEIVNLFLTQTATKAMEKKTAIKYTKVIQGYKAKIEAQKKTIKEFEEIQEESVRKIMAANQKLKAYEEKSGIAQDDLNLPEETPESDKEKQPAKDPEKKEAEKFVDLPSGSNRKQLPI